MAQATQITLDNQTFPSFRSKLNESLNALNSLHSGTSRPASATTGTIWLDVTNSGSNSLTVKFFDGSDDISLATIDTSANTVNWLDSSVTLTSPVSISGSSSAGAEIRLPEDTDNGSNYVGLKASDSISSNVTFTLPNADGTADQIIKTDGSGNLSFTDVSGGTDWQSSIKTANFTATSGEGYFINTSGGAFEVDLPSSPSVGDEIEFVDFSRSFGTNALTLDQGSNKFQGNATSPKPVYDTDGQSIRIVYSGSTQGWIPLVDDDVTFETPQTVSADILIVAGGGSQGNGLSDPKYASGGGGAGGFRTSTSGLTPGASYTVTVGAGGVQNASSGTGTNGSDSSISGTGVSITSAGGGCGGDGVNDGEAATVQGGQNGGSGGGGGAIKQTAGSGNTPSTSPSQGNNGGTGSTDGVTAGGGGGGAGATGANGNGDVAGGNGGNGTASSITGSSVTYAGGGGGGCGLNNSNNGTAGTGGSGGGGNGNGSGIGNNGTANTGGGGGGSRGDSGGTGGTGGSGVVIIRVLTADYSGTTTGSPTVTTDGSHKVIKFTGSGSYTA